MRTGITGLLSCVIVVRARMLTLNLKTNGVEAINSKNWRGFCIGKAAVMRSGHEIPEKCLGFGSEWLAMGKVWVCG